MIGQMYQNVSELNLLSKTAAPEIIDLSEAIAAHRLRVSEDNRVYGKGYDRTLCRCGAEWRTPTGIAHALCFWMYHQRGEILKAAFGEGALTQGDGLTSQGYVDAEAARVDKS